MSFVPLGIPTYETPLQLEGRNVAVWYRFFQGVWNGTPPQTEQGLTVTASPFSYVAPRKGFVILTGGTVSAVSFTRTATYPTGQTAGIFPVSQGDTLNVTYSVKPTLTFVPQ